MNEPIVISLPQLQQLIPFSKTKIYKLIKNNGFPPSKKLDGIGKALWRIDEVNNWLLENMK